MLATQKKVKTCGVGLPHSSSAVSLTTLTCAAVMAMVSLGSASGSAGIQELAGDESRNGSQSVF
jgi:hypothetical protein